MTNLLHAIGFALNRWAMRLLPPPAPGLVAPSEGTTGADEHDRPLWSAMDK